MISTRTHGVLDYGVSLLLIGSPYIPDFATGGVEQWLPMILGIATIVMSLLTDYELSIRRIIPMRLHLAADFVSGLFLACSPWLLDFSEIVWWPHLLFGVLSMFVSLATERREEKPLYQ